MTDIWSFGGGVQSVRMLTLVLSGQLRTPDIVIMADTGRERTKVWEYIDQFVIPALNSIGRELEVVPHSYSRVDLYSSSGKVLLPAYFNGKDGTGKLPTFCSTEWKQRPVRRRLRELGYGPDNPVTMWFGMSLDEVGRMRQSDVRWIKNYYPLCQDPAIRQRRHECLKGILEYGWPVPPRSSCWTCPNRDDDTWREMMEDGTVDFADACELERSINDRIFLHRSLVPLSKVDFTPKDGSPSLFDECSYSCFT